MKIKNKFLILAPVVLIVISFASFITAVFIKNCEKRENAANVLPKVAIVLDDWGYNKKYFDILDSIDAALTISILPELPYSEYIAEREMKFSNREVIVHMPMEPESRSVRLEKLTLLTSMSKDDAENLLDSAFNSIPNAKGISNHMGSKATADPALMKVVLTDVKERNVYFLDSFSSDKSVCEDIAGSLKLNFIKRDVFLDNILKKDYIVSQLNELINVAKKNGRAVGIGHNHKLTLEVIKEKTDCLKGAEVEFVLVSELIDNKRQKDKR